MSENEGAGNKPEPGAGTKPEPGAGGDPPNYVRLKVVSQDGNEIHFRVKKSTAIGRRLEDHETPETLNMDDEDQIDATLEQVGGGWDI